MSLEFITPPAIEPVTLEEAKAHLKVDTSDDDDLIARNIAAARVRIELHLGRALITQSWIQWLDCWPANGIIEVSLPPLQSVTSITTYAPDNTPTVLDPATYQVDAVSQPARIIFPCSFGVPALPDFVPGLRRANSIAVAFTAGYGDAATDVPAPIIEAILELIAFSYENRGEAEADMPLDALALLSPYRILNL
jgi:uncharacterized phiE125 gp8 family phage protein